MTQRNLIGLVLSYLYAFGLLGLAEAIRRWRGYSQAFTRKLVHTHKRSDSFRLGNLHPEEARQRSVQS